jgi:hypothetical protein
MAQRQESREHNLYHKTLQQYHINLRNGLDPIPQHINEPRAHEVNIGEIFITAPELESQTAQGKASAIATVSPQLSLDPRLLEPNRYREQEIGSDYDTVSQTSPSWDSYAGSFAGSQFDSREYMGVADHDADCDYDPSTDVEDRSVTAAILTMEYKNGDFDSRNHRTVHDLDDHISGFLDVDIVVYGEGSSDSDIANFFAGSAAAQPSYAQETSATTHTEELPGDRSKARTKRYHCNRCGKTTGRAGDMRRHYKIHFPEQVKYPCTMEGCNRKDRNGFYRPDKLRDHLRKAHPEWSQTWTLSNVA